MKQIYSISTHSTLKNITLFIAINIVMFTILRIWILYSVWAQTGILQTTEVLTALSLGVAFDISTMIYALSPLVFLLVLLWPRSTQNKIAQSYRRTLVLSLSGGFFLLILTCIGEILFWNEFHNRPNFIAVDYIVYTHELLRNAYESYPIVWILLAGVLVAFLLAKRTIRKIDIQTKPGFGLLSRGTLLTLWIGLLTINYFLFNMDFSQLPKRNSIQEASKNGVYSVFYAYFNNELNYDKFYATLDESKIFSNVRKQMQREGALLESNTSDIARRISSKKFEHRYNIVLVSMESMSARFMRYFGNDENLTANLDRLAHEGLFFDNIFATGTRTVRGLEALMLSIPPTPGQSILRRPLSNGLYNIADYFSDMGYVSEFLYGGHAYFDNMKSFFSTNEVNVLDRSDMSNKDVTFSNAWGACDQNLFSLALRQADSSDRTGKNFFQLIMTTSNHRPYTYPQVIDVPSGANREGAVKYADFSIGEYLDQARTRPWFKNTLFIFVADHDASVAGKDEVPVADYRIPLIFYAPALIKPKIKSVLGSQIDVGPTILGLLGLNYQSHFFGHDLTQPKIEQRAIISNYQKLGFLKENTLIILGPNRKVEQYQISKSYAQKEAPLTNKSLIEETIAYYQSASLLFSRQKLKDQGDDLVFLKTQK